MRLFIYLFFAVYYSHGHGVSYHLKLQGEDEIVRVVFELKELHLE